MSFKVGKLTIFMGPMGSGKTEKLVNLANKEASYGSKVLIVGSNSDTRSDSVLSTNGAYIDTELRKCDKVKVNTLSQVDVKDNDWIFIDEAHMYPDLVSYVVKWLQTDNKNIVVAGIDGDINKKPIGEILYLIPYATSGCVYKLDGRCSKCVQDGLDQQYCASSYTILKTIDTRVGQFKIGGLDMYESVCLKHSIIKV